MKRVKRMKKRMKKKMADGCNLVLFHHCLGFSDFGSQFGVRTVLLVFSQSIPCSVLSKSHLSICMKCISIL